MDRHVQLGHLEAGPAAVATARDSAVPPRPPSTVLHLPVPVSVRSLSLSGMVPQYADVFPSSIRSQTWLLVFMLVLLKYVSALLPHLPCLELTRTLPIVCSGIDWAAFCILDIGNQLVEALPVGTVSSP